VRLFSSLQLVIAAPACKPGQDTPANLCSRLNHWPWVSHRLWRCVRPWPRVSPLLSQAAFYLTVQRCCFLTSPAVGSFSRNVPGSRVLPDACAPFVRLSAFFVGRFQCELLPPETSAPWWYTVAAVHPLGDCDSSGNETFPDYLTQLTAVSNRGLPPSPSFAL